MSRIVTTSRKGKSAVFRRSAWIASTLLLVAAGIAFVYNRDSRSAIEMKGRADSATRDFDGKVNSERKTIGPADLPSGGNGHEHPVSPKTPTTVDITSHIGDVTLSTNVAADEYTGIRSINTNAPAPFSNPIETILGMALSADDDSAIPPLPISGDDSTLNDQMRAALTNDIVIYDTDDASVVAFKERVADFKVQLKNVLDNGGDVAKALLEYQNYINEGAQVRNEVVLKHMQLQKEATEEEARNFLEVANQALESEGISPITEDKSPRRRGSGTIQE